MRESLKSLSSWLQQNEISVKIDSFGKYVGETFDSAVEGVDTLFSSSPSSKHLTANDLEAGLEEKQRPRQFDSGWESDESTMKNPLKQELQET